MQQELNIVTNYGKQVGLLLAIGGALIQMLPYSKRFEKIGLNKEEFLWLKSELTFKKHEYFAELMSNFGKECLNSALKK